MVSNNSDSEESRPLGSAWNRRSPEVVGCLSLEIEKKHAGPQSFNWSIQASHSIPPARDLALYGENLG
jgi:hypothetical protein